MTNALSLIGWKSIKNRVLVYIYDDGNTSLDLGGGKRLITGLTDTHFDSLHNVTDSKHPGIRARWAMVIGINENTPNDIKLGDKVLLEQMKWRRGIYATKTQRIWDIKVDDVLVVDDDNFTEEEIPVVAEYLAAFDLTIDERLAILDNTMPKGLTALAPLIAEQHRTTLEEQA